MNVRVVHLVVWEVHRQKKMRYRWVNVVMGSGIHKEWVVVAQEKTIALGDVEVIRDVWVLVVVDLAVRDGTRWIYFCRNNDLYRG